MKKHFTHTSLTALLALFALLLLPGMGWGQSYLGLDGGLEGTATIDNSTIYTAAQNGKWVKANSTTTIANETSTVRSGTNALRIQNTSTTGRRVWAPNMAVNTSSQVVIQYYRRVAVTTDQTSQEGINRNSTETLSGNYGNGTANTWTKVTYAPTSVVATNNLLWGILMTRAGTTTGDIFIDDMCVYVATAADVTAPNAPTAGSPTVGSATGSSLSVSWTAPVAGTDNGGYLVVRGTSDPTTAPNVNGIYAVGNTIGAGTVVYQGTGTSFTDNGLVAVTQYYYRIYTYDKAYNYSSALTANGTTSAATIPTLTTTAISNIMKTTASSGGNITSDGGASVTARGVCWSESPNPSLANSFTTNGTGVGSFTSAITGLTANTLYYVRAYATNSAGTAYGNQLSFTTKKATETVSTVTNFSDLTNIGSETDITVSGHLTIDEIAEINNLTLTPAGKTTITLATGLIVNGNLLLQSDATGTASLLHNAADLTVSGSTTIQRYAAGGWLSWDAGWHAISSPVASQAISAFTTSGDNNGYDFYGWAENTNTWMNFKAGTFSDWNGGTNNFNPGQGYLISYETTQTGKAFTGTINTGNIPKTNLSFTNGQGNGWHLLGNPFSSALKWETANWARTNVAGTAKIWSESGKSYVDIPADGIIPSAQGFMVQVNSATNSITIPAASRLHHAQNWYKNGNNTKIQLVAAEANNASQQESNILVNSQATAGFDFEYDSRFLPGYAPQFYSLAAAEKLSTNSLPSLNNAASIPFGFVKNQATNYKIELKEKIEGQTIFLTDLKTNVSQNLNNNPVYSFTAAQGDNPNRFIVHFGMVGTGEQPTTQALNAYVYGKTLYLVSEKESAQLQIFDLQGRLVQQNPIKAKGIISQTLALPAGVYLLRLQSADATQSVKIFVQ